VLNEAGLDETIPDEVTPAALPEWPETGATELLT
jgi:hypothetical protein